MANPAYTFHAAGAFASTLVGGNLTPAMAAFAVGELGFLQTSCNSTTLGSPTIAGWTRVSPNNNGKCASLYLRIMQAGDVAPTFQWDASHGAFARIFTFGGSVYRDLATIVAFANDRGTASPGSLGVPLTSAPPVANCLTIRGGHCVKSATNDGSTFRDWLADAGLYTKVGNNEVVQTGHTIAGTCWYQQQTVPTATSLDQAPLTNTDASDNTQGFTIFLQTATTITTAAGAESATGQVPSVVRGNNSVLAPDTAFTRLRRKYFLPPRILIPA